jgi:succinate dehydrogenase / fumarate reductase cytochrome b subunit
MTWKQVFTSSIGKKLVMSFTGLFLISFLLVHVSINACIFADLFDSSDDGAMFNKAAHFMGSMVLIRILEVGLFAGIFLHLIQGYILTAQNNSKRSEGYKVPLGNRGSTWYSRSMGLLGTILLIFMILHWWHFWVPARFIGHPELTEVDLNNTAYHGVAMHNMFNLMKFTFSELWVVILYVVACISLAYHLLHGFQSSFRTIGLHNKKWMNLVKSVGAAFSILVPLLFALMPIAVYLHWVE